MHKASILVSTFRGCRANLPRHFQVPAARKLTLRLRTYDILSHILLRLNQF